ncbi:autophagy protein Apg9-domain-containing protein [Lasiosphaeria miniovina]|uniref:Autophagy-related protein 9 n=1 Tax=Lasiosphaeria miniovina TaxID=1954250 RepID=A0AA40ADW0_9PEZI|nr:autophagy protein Apg9-domain-containing protein [Lasiosphaeria miniovina]KAK0713848.1 autophagy protein Apg9-domain-containing protein [Lasiosphaeria miniovina]
MASNVFSRLMPSTRGRSFYEELRGRDDTLENEEHAGLLDDENLNHNFQDYDLESAQGLAVDDSRITLGGAPTSAPRGRGRLAARTHLDAGMGWASHDDDGDNDVPASLLVERHDRDNAGGPGQPTRNQAEDPTAPIPGPSGARPQWETTQVRQRLHNDEAFNPSRSYSDAPNALLDGVISGSAKKKAEWRWANVSNLDNFIKDVYDYYQGCGMWCILTERILHLINVAFVALLLTFLTQCVDYKRVRESQKLSEILVPQCTSNMSGLWNLGLWMFAFYFIWKSIQYLLDVRRLLHVRDFFLYMLSVPDQDMQTVTWQDIVARVMALRDQNPNTATNLTPAQRRFLGSQSKERLDASDIANRLMRRENYLIALFNKDVLDLTIPIPFLQNRQLLSRTLEWTLMFSVLDFVFDEKGQVNQEFLRSDRRGELSAKLRGRFMFAGVMILILSPFVTGYLIIVYFLMYYHEVQKNPSVLSSRTYTPLAEWKFREFNELPHLFKKRLDMSHPFATHYMDQFPKVKTEMIAKTVAFIAGSLATVLAVVSVFDPELFLGFEITPDRTVLFYTAVFGSVWAVARGTMSEDNAVFDPEYALRNVIEYTHYEPDRWHDRLHSFDVKREFSELYKVKIVIFIEEILSILTTPFVLFASLPKSSDQIIDFFREFTIHVDGLGYVCSFAEFDFKKGVGNSKRHADGADVRDDYYSTKHGKMEASYYGFLGNYGNYALNPKMGVPAPHLPPGMRNQFHPPPAWPGMSSPTLGPDMQASRMGRSERARSKAPPAKTPRFGPIALQSSPMASILLDPHHQPPNPGFGHRTTHIARQQRGIYQGEGNNIIEESLEDGGEESDVGKRHDEDEVYESGGALEDSTWQTSAARTLSRENSGAEERGAPDAGVVRMIYQFNQAQLNRRPGGVR